MNWCRACGGWTPPSCLDKGICSDCQKNGDLNRLLSPYQIKQLAYEIAKNFGSELMLQLYKFENARRDEEERLKSLLVETQEEPGRDIPVEELRLSTRVRHVCIRCGLKTAGDIQDAGKYGLLMQRQFGWSSACEVERVLKDRGLSFPDKSEIGVDELTRRRNEWMEGHYRGENHYR